MRSVITLDELYSARLSLEGTVGLVPTMGFLHEGHLSLIRQARQECDQVVVSIFVNPTQFGKNEDLSKYPRDIDRDLKLIEPLTDLVWMPTAEIMYPKGYQTWVEVESITSPLEGSMRPGHFKGVTTVVAKLFNGVQPHKAYFGQKDAQQVADAVDRQIIRNYRLQATHFIAYAALGGDDPRVEAWRAAIAEEKLAQARAKFAVRLAHLPTEHRKILLTMYANPVLRRLELCG